MIIVFLSLCIDPLSSKTKKTMIKFLTQYLQGLGQKESLHVYGNIQLGRKVPSYMYKNLLHVSHQLTISSCVSVRMSKY